MKNCERLVNSGYFSPTQPAKLLAQSFREMQVSSVTFSGKGQGWFPVKYIYVQSATSDYRKYFVQSLYIFICYFHMQLVGR